MDFTRMYQHKQNQIGSGVAGVYSGVLKTMESKLIECHKQSMAHYADTGVQKP